METPEEIVWKFFGGAVVALVAWCLFSVFRWRSTGLHTTQFQNGFWLISWYTNEIDSVETVKCGDRSFHLTLRRINDQVTLSVKENQATVWCDDQDVWSTNEEPFEPGSQQQLIIHASRNGQLEAFPAPDRGQSASVSWPNVSEEFASYQLIVEFKDPIAPSNNNQLLNVDKGERQLLTHLSKLLDTQSMSDVTFIVKNEKIGAHSAIVASASPVICAMLETDKFKEGRDKVVEVDDIGPSVFKEMLRYLYTGKDPQLNEDEMTEQLFLAAHKYQIEALKNFCEQSLISKLNVQTAVHYLIVAHLHTAPLLLEASLEFLVKHKKEVRTRPEWNELLNNHPDLFFLAANRMIG